MLGLITARGKSKGIPRKNLHPLCGKPLLQYTCEAATRSKLDRTIITTDDPEIAECARKLGVEAPFLRPDELSRDDSPSIDAVRHCVEWLRVNEHWMPDAVVLLQPTSPLRTHKHIDQAIELFESTDADSLVSVVLIPHNFFPHNVMVVKDGLLENFLPQPLPIEPKRRQELPVLYARNGPAIVMTKVDCLIKTGLYGVRIIPFVMNMEDSIDINEISDITTVEQRIHQLRTI